MEKYYTLIVYILAGLVGLCVGSFLNVVIYRLPNGMSLATPPSHCTKCNYRLRWYDNIPVLSYIMLGGKCRKCKTHISPRYVVVELLNAALWLLTVHLFWERNTPTAIAYALALSVFLCILFIDLSHGLIFDRFHIILLTLGIVTTVFDPYREWYAHFIGAAVGFLFFYLVAFVFEKLAGREGLGGGDIKLAGAVGFLIGWEKLVLGIFLATVPLAIVLLFLRAFGGKRIEALKGREIPFGPALVTGFAVAMLYGTPIITWYLSLLGF